MAHDQAPGASLSRSEGWQPLSVTDPDLVAPLETDEDDPMLTKTGTTIVAITAGDAVVLAADRRASIGGGRFVSNKDVLKIEEVHPTAAVAGSGAVGHLQQFNDILRAESSLYEQRRGEPMSLNALSKLAANLLGGRPMMVAPLLAGIDEDGPKVFSIDGGGGRLGDDYSAAGSGMQMAYGVLEREYEPDLSLADAKKITARAIAASVERDTASGNGLTVAVVTDEGVETTEYDSEDELRAVADGEEVEE